MKSDPQADPQLRDNKTDSALVIKQEYNEFYSGPLPAPQTLEGYEGVVPGSAERIIKMAESQVCHRQEMERKRIEADIADGRKAMNYALLISLIIIGCGTSIILLNPSIGGYISGSLLNLAGVSSVINAFLRKETPPQKEEGKE